MRRMLSHLTGISSLRLQAGDLDDTAFPTDMDMIAEATARLKTAPLYIDDQSGLSIPALRVMAHKLKRQQGLHAVFIDYLQLMSSVGSSRYEKVTNISQGLKLLAKELSVPVICLSQLRRPTDGQKEHRPQLTDLRESGQIEQDADKIIFLTRDTEATPNLVQAIVAKHRDGPIGDAPLGVDLTTGRWSDADWSEFLEE